MGHFERGSAVREVLGRVRRVGEVQSVFAGDTGIFDVTGVLGPISQSDVAGSLRPVLIGGCPRSGTTFVGAMLGLGLEQLTVPEAQFKWTLLQGIDEQGQLDLEWAFNHLRRDWKFALWQLHLGRPPLHPNKVRYEHLLQALVRAYGAASGKPNPSVWIDHTPANIRHALRLSQAIPTAKFVHLVRDGRAVAASVMPLDWGPNNVFEAARWWAAEVAMGLAAVNRLGADTVATVRYEDIVQGRLAPLGEACARFGLTFSDPAMARLEYTVQPYTAKQHRYVGREPIAGRAHAWRNKLSPRQIETFEYLTGDLLGLLGYELDYGSKARAPRKRHHVSDATTGLIRRQLLDKARRVARRHGRPGAGRVRWNRPHPL